MMAQQNKVAVIALSQLNRAGDAQPTMINLRESGQIEQDADAILFLHQEMGADSEEDKKRKLLIGKNKEGETGFIDFQFDGTTQRFSDTELPQEGSAPPL